MVTVGIRELSQNASPYVRMAMEGTRIAVTDPTLSQAVEEFRGEEQW
jgi:hypothetical protein